MLFRLPAETVGAINMEDAKFLFDQVRFENMDRLLKRFSGFEKLTGTEEAEKAVDYILDELSRYGVPNERYVLDAYLSNPKTSSFRVFGDGSEIATRPRSFSGNCPEGVTGELIFDVFSEGASATEAEKRKAFREFKGKIVVCYGYDEGYARTIADSGAVGIVQIWPSGEDALHEDTVGTVWGTPTFDTVRFLIDIPVVSIKRGDGSALAERLKEGRLTATLRSEVETKVYKVSFPIATIKGETDDFLLLSGHYDTWYDGIIDNGTSNAACLEIARLLLENRKSLRRSVKIAWWPGHSNGRYMGSTWYCDAYWDSLYEHCVANFNTDCIGSKGSDSVFVKTTGLEGKSFTGEIIKNITGSYPAEYGTIGRGADQSFWGPGIPFHISARHEVGRDHRIYSCPGSGVWWWHTPEDTYDKIDEGILVQDTRILLGIVYELATNSALPFDCDTYFAGIKSILESADASSDPEFAFSDFYAWLAAIEEKTKRLLSRNDISDSTRNRLIKLIGGEMNRLTHSYSGRYEPDLAVFRKPFPYVSVVSGVKKKDTPEDDFLFMKTEFVRQRNRFVTDIKRLLREIDLVVPTLGAL